MVGSVSFPLLQKFGQLVIERRAASCSVPLIFSAVSILAKDPKTGEAVPWNPSPQRWIDGSVDNDLPMTRLAELFNVNHFIVSQVNPHVVPFLVKDEDLITQEARQSTTTLTPTSNWLRVITHLAKGEALHRMHTLADVGIFPNTLTKAVSVLSQKYSGDINIFPEISYADFPRMLSNPTAEFMLQAQISGERATWPKLSRIRNHCAIELALDEAVHRLRARVAFSPSPVDLKIVIQTRSNSDMRNGERGYNRQKNRPMSQKSAPEMPATSLGLHFPIDLQQEAEAEQRRAEAHDDLVPPTPSPTTETSVGVARALKELTLPSADTCNLTSSSSSPLSSSSPTRSSSPSSPIPSKPHHHPFFHSNSQPATPSYRSTSFPLKSPSLMPHNTLLSASNLLMTPKHPPAVSPEPSSAESRYKRLFHHRRSSGGRNSGGSRGRGVTRGEDAMKRNWMNGIDIISSNGFSLRKKEPPSQ